MEFTYTLSGKAIENGQNRVTVDYSYNGIKCSETFFITTEEALRDRIEAKEKSLTEAAALDAKLTVGSYMKLEKPVEPVKEPEMLTPEQVKKQEYELKEIELIEAANRSKRYKEITEIAGNDPTIAVKLAELVALKEK